MGNQTYGAPQLGNVTVGAVGIIPSSTIPNLAVLANPAPIMQSSATASSGVNQARLYIVSTLNGPIQVSTVHFGCNVASGNVDGGIYQLSGSTLTRLSSSGSTPCPTANSDVSVTLSAPVTLNPATGPYYLALAVDNTSVSNFAGGSANSLTAPLVGLTSYRFNSAFPLPSSLAVASNVGADAMWIVWAK